MAITVSGGSQVKRGVFQSSETLTGATGSAQAVSLVKDVSEFAASTATTGLFTLADGLEGQEKVLMQTGTGTLNKVTPASMAGGWTAFLMSATDHFGVLRFINGKWHVFASHYHRAIRNATATENGTIDVQAKFTAMVT